jgi:hypothetical protein
LTAGTDQAMAMMSALRLEDGRSWGAGAHPVQVDAARAVLDTEYCAAADADQSALLLRAIDGFVRRSPILSAHVEVQSRRVVFPRPGVELVVMASDAASSYGLLPAWLLLDELCQWPSSPNARAFYEALMTALPKVPRSRAAIISTAGSPGHWSGRVLDGALAEPDLWRVSETHGPPPWMEPRLIEAERRRLPPSLFARLFLNEWAQGEDRLTSPEDVSRCVGHSGPLPPAAGRRYVVSLDVGLTSDACVVSVAHAERRAGAIVVVVDRQLVWTGTRERPGQRIHVLVGERRPARPLLVPVPQGPDHRPRRRRPGPSRGAGLGSAPREPTRPVPARSRPRRPRRPGRLRRARRGDIARQAGPRAGDGRQSGRRPAPSDADRPRRRRCPDRGPERRKVDPARRAGPYAARSPTSPRTSPAVSVSTAPHNVLGPETGLDLGDLVDELLAMMVAPALHDQAACRGSGLSWFPARGQSTRELKEICRTCPVIEECRESASEEQFGVWGGESHRERRFRRRRERAATP